jgi:O-antigen/teichoic acid export membrane protein
MLAAYALRNYWALLIGVAAGYLSGIIVSYIGHPYRPRLCLTKARELLSFSKHMIIYGMGSFAESRADEIIVARTGASQQLGLYSVASEMGQLPGAELAAPLNRVLLPTLAKIQDEPGRLRLAYLNFVGLVNALTIPAAAGLALVAGEFVEVILGWKWRDAVPLLQMLALYGATRCAYESAVNLFMAIGRPTLAARLSWLNVSFFVAAGLYAMATWGILGVAVARFATGVVVTAVALFVVTRVTEASGRDLISRLWRPLAACVPMAVAVMALADLPGPAVVELATKVTVGGLTYFATLGVLWVLVGRPAGAEQAMLVYASSALRTWRSRRAADGPGA